MIDLIRQDLRQQAGQPRAVSGVSVVHEEPDVPLVPIDVEMIDSARVERRRTANDAVHLIPLLSNSSARYDPSWPVMPVISARVTIDPRRRSFARSIIHAS